MLVQQGIDWIPPGLIVGLRATNSDESTTGVGRRRVYVNAISLPQTCRSNWHAIQPTTNRVMAGHHQPLNVDADLLQKPHMREFQGATLKMPA